jgi:hypothetical protein
VRLRFLRIVALETGTCSASAASLVGLLCMISSRANLEDECRREPRFDVEIFQVIVMSGAESHSLCMEIIPSLV